RYVEGSFMVGAHPDETKQDIELTRKLIFEIDPDILMLAIMVPYPGAEVYQLMQDEGYLDQGIKWDHFVFFSYQPAWRTKHFSGSDLMRIHRQILRQFYLRPKYVFKTLKKLRSLGELKYWFSEGLDFINKTK
ncbi:MAG: hypothetical protein HQ595_03480, partial [Candidatus Omnitrophica bacterium]|nr:hypothetical protein [Candidatus Omnitrophota bacterium]